MIKKLFAFGPNTVFLAMTANGLAVGAVDIERNFWGIFFGAARSQIASVADDFYEGAGFMKALSEMGRSH